MGRMKGLLQQQLRPPTPEHTQEQLSQCLRRVNPEATSPHHLSSTAAHRRTTANYGSGQQVTFTLAAGSTLRGTHHRKALGLAAVDLYCICGIWVAVHLYIPDPRDGMEKGQTKTARKQRLLPCPACCLLTMVGCCSRTLRFGHGHCGFSRDKDRHSTCPSRTNSRDFPGGPVVKNPPCNAGDQGSIPGRGTKIPHAEEQLSWSATTIHQESMCRNRRSHMMQLRSNAAT
ncbi:uncharacterized protein LOC129655187 isoform X1 [Bubalus kerabau]|uniref:uncharacterized protein LOC129655187 isoform X1 n=1 Tax=Bubalus carabanensis TaxID=3119969 RepID=UPI00244E755D|nr:uncharacterized protein LOC129655187 isoform X1 [Bubalus carabanensis]